MQNETSGSAPSRNLELQRLEQLRRVLSRMDEAHDAQRQTLARELHHKIVGSLSAVKMECDWLLRPQRADEALRPRLQRLSEELGQTIQYTRDLIGELWPVIVGHLGLSSALSEEVAGVRARSAASIEVVVEGDVDDIPEAHAFALFRLLQQALERCEAAPACELRIVLRRSAAGVELHIEQETSAVVDDDLLLMEERVSRLGGQLNRAAVQPGRSRIDVLLPA
jgi:signal transduction histidine kinase